MSYSEIFEAQAANIVTDWHYFALANDLEAHDNNLFGEWCRQVRNEANEIAMEHVDTYPLPCSEGRNAEQLVLDFQNNALDNADDVLWHIAAELDSWNLTPTELHKELGIY